MKAATTPRLVLDLWDSTWSWPPPAPDLWGRLLPRHRLLVCGLAVEMLLATPDALPGAFAAHLLEALRARGAAAASSEETAAWHELDVLLSQYVSDLPDLQVKLAGRGRGDLIARLRQQHAALGDTLRRLEALVGTTA